MKKYTVTLDSHSKPFKIGYTEDLNAEQYKVVTEADGPCLVLAGPGSGKTRTLIYRLVYILENGISPQNVLLMTFTNKAAHQMRQRLEVLLKSKPTGLWCGTFHHVGNRSLRMYAKHVGLRDDFGILDEGDQKDLIKLCIKTVRDAIDNYKLFPSPGVIKTIISYSRNAKQAIEKTIDIKYPHVLDFTNEIKEINRLYEEKKRQSNNLDYDDLLTEWIRLLKTSPSARMRFTKQFRYILVDEYQDTNRLQFDIIKLLSEYHKNLLVVGDDAQSIYSFRAADIRNILDFPSRFKDTKIFKLQTNYRSVSPILNLANHIIEKNEQQFKKEISGARKEGKDIKPNLIPVKDLYSQSAFVAQRITELQKEGTTLNEIAILYRAHYQSVELELELIKRGIPYVIRGGVRFFEQAHIKDVLAYCRIMQNPRDELSWVRVLSLHSGIGNVYADKIFQRFSSSRLSLKGAFDSSFSKFLPKKAGSGFNQFKQIMRKLINQDLPPRPDTMIQEILNHGYKSFVLTRFDNGRDRLDDIKELVNFAHTYKNLKEFLADVTLREGFKGETILNTSSGEDESLVLSTIHQAKGLEWKYVFIIGLCDGQFPHPKSFDEPGQIEEERRLFYVATTRSKDELYLLHPMTRYDYNYGTVTSRPSLFLQELPLDSYERWGIEEEGSSLDEKDVSFEDI